jgi:hypothetical protein
MEGFRQKRMMVDELSQPGERDAANCFRESDKKFSTSDLMVLAVVQLQMDDDAAAPAPTTL